MNLLTATDDRHEMLRHRGLALVVILAVAFAAGAFDDDLTPFKSFFFILGSAAIYHVSLHFGLLLSWSLACAMGTIMLSQSLVATDAVADVSFHMVEVPLALAFFLLLAVIPSIVPTILRQTRKRLEMEKLRLEERESELMAAMDTESKGRSDEKRERVEKVDMRFSSRNATLVSFSREAVRAETPGEVVHLLFRTFCRNLGEVEIVEIGQGDRPGSLVVERFFPPKRTDLAELELPPDDAVLGSILKTGAASAFREGAEVAGAFRTHLITPLAWQRNLLCLFSFHWGDGELDNEMQEAVQTLVAVAQGCINRQARRKGGGA